MDLNRGKKVIFNELCTEPAGRNPSEGNFEYISEPTWVKKLNHIFNFYQSCFLHNYLYVYLSKECVYFCYIWLWVFGEIADRIIWPPLCDWLILTSEGLNTVGSISQVLKDTCLTAWGDILSMRRGAP